MTHCSANSLSLTLVKKKTETKNPQSFGDIQTWETASMALQDLESGLLPDSFPPVKAEGPDNPVLCPFPAEIPCRHGPKQRSFPSGH